MRVTCAHLMCGALALLCSVSVNVGVADAEAIDFEIEKFSYPEKHQNTRRACEISNENSPPWTALALHMDCSFKDFKSGDLSEVLPLYADVLDLSWNALTEAPAFASDTLRQLNLMHNNISRVTSKNFAKLPKLKELFLNWNSIQTIELNGFEGLAQLQVLDLSHNNLHALNAKLFAPMPILDVLSLSWNRQLNYTSSIQELDFYQSFGVNVNLRILQLEACNLGNVVLPAEAALIDLNLRRNQLTSVPKQLPIGLQKIDLSDNLFTALTPNETTGLGRVQELYLEDMPIMQTVTEGAFMPLQSLRKVSFQNSRRLNTFDGYAFGRLTPATETDTDTNSRNHTDTDTAHNQSRNDSSHNTDEDHHMLPPLHKMIFRGTSLRGFNSTLAPVFKQLTELDLNGMPLLCDCEMIWVKQLGLETDGRCFKPSRLRGRRLSEAVVKDFSCNRWPRWVYSLIMLVLIILCSFGIYLLVMSLRPHRGVTLRRKVGAGSPYARVTIEPNRQENL